MNPFKLMLHAPGVKKRPKERFVVLDLQSTLPLDESTHQKLRVTGVLGNIRVLGLFTPYWDYPVLPRYPDNALQRDAERVGGYMRKAIGQHAGRWKGPVAPT